MKNTTKLRNLIRDKSIIMMPGVYDCLTARLAEETGFEAVIITGAGLVASVLGFPDIGLISMSEVLVQTRNIVRSTKLPVFADCDTGYGNPLNVFRTVQEFEDAGVAGLFIEDQVFPKRCGHFAGKQVISKEEMIKKIEAALDARRDKDLVIMARTDARAVYGLEDALERAQAYVEAGVDMIFVEAPQTIEEIAQIPKSVRAPTMINLVEGGKTPLVSVDELEKMGYKFATFSGSAQKTALKAMREFLLHLKETRSLDGVLDRIISLKERSDLLDLPKFYEMENKYTANK
ncbi:MAG: oxaloacetate decarboxylase [Deltaproteobacteria bacterium]|nr:MAG: oxaloacetate decarboxylase [Deltaproteobacteria bacterium]